MAGRRERATLTLEGDKDEESLSMGPLYPVIPCMKPVVREDWKSLLHALKWGNRTNPRIQTAAMEEDGPVSAEPITIKH